MKYQKELKENEAITKIINEKAENSLKYITQIKTKIIDRFGKIFT